VTRQPVVWQTRKAGGGTVWVHRRRGGWRPYRFVSGPSRLAKLAALSEVLGRFGAAMTPAAPSGCLQVAQTAPGPAAEVPALLPRPGPSPLAPNAP
jgi:hypothetical protein